MAGWRIMIGNLLLADDWWRFTTCDFFWGDILLLVTFLEVTFGEVPFS